MHPTHHTKGIIIRTGTVLRVVCRPLAIAGLAFLALPSSSGLAREGVEPRTAEGFASLSEPGAIGVLRPLQPGPRPESMLPLHVQPVQIAGPPGLEIAIETAAGWTPSQSAPLRMGLVIGRPYRLRLTGVPGREGEELYPSLRLLAKLATPPGMAWRFPVEVTLEQDDLEKALAGSLVRRAVYVSCEAEAPPAAWFDVQPGDDCLAVAATLGDPVAEVVLGNRVPSPGVVP
ncbi:MAG: hypothetical protein O3A37_05355 [Planctomycetota bacterium]|nr:hypothetical protein [Planctomycetota bacterium]